MATARVQRQLAAEPDTSAALDEPTALARGTQAERFEPLQREIKVQLGEEKLVHFRATNISQRPIVGTATYNVTPERTAGWFNKVQCFCFTEQLLQPGQSVDMPVVFFVDAEMAKDRRYDDIRTITLSYTFYEAKTERAKTLLGGTPANGTGKGG